MRRKLRRLLVPLDFTERDAPVVATALLVAEASRAATTLLHVVYVPNDASRRELEAFYRELAGSARAKLERHAKKFERRRLKVTVAVASGIPLDEILARDATDLIVLSSHPVEPERPVPGWDTLSYKVAALCRCPVLLAK